MKEKTNVQRREPKPKAVSLKLTNAVAQWAIQINREGMNFLINSADLISYPYFLN